MAFWWSAVASAADVQIQPEHRPPAELPLFSRAAVAQVRGTVKGGDCQAAVAAALAEAGEGGMVLGLVRSPSDLSPLGSTTCKQRLAGDAVSASVVDLAAIVVQPGANPQVYPKLSAARSAEIVLALHEVWEEGEPAPPMQIEEVEGQAWVRFPALVEPQELDSRALDSNQRGALLYERHVSSWVVRWARALSAIPEVRGASLEIAVTSADVTQKKSRKTELFRFFIPTDKALAFASGTIADGALVKASRVERATDPKKRDFLQFLLDVEDASLPSSTTVVEKKERQGLDELDEIDIEDE